LNDEALGLDVGTAAAYLKSNQQFFETWGSRLTVLNGIDMETNNHDSGSRATWSGRLDEGFPSIGALIAATRAPGSSLGYISNGGYDATAGLVPLTRLSSVDAIQRIAYPNETDPTNPDTEYFHNAGTRDRIRKAQEARLSEQLSKQRLPRGKKSMNELVLARAGDDALTKLVIPETLADLPGYQLSDLENVMQSAQLAVAAFKAGMAVSCNLNLGGFDTHADHDRDQVLQLSKLLTVVDFLMAEAETAGIADDLVIMMGSDFGRGYGYNGPGQYDGKDHWSITSAMFMGKGIAGNRVIGGTNDEQGARGINTSSLEIEKSGTVLKPGAIHKALRKIAGVADGAPAKSFGLSGDEIGKLLSG
jgi:hypothetical protein